MLNSHSSDHRDWSLGDASCHAILVDMQQAGVRCVLEYGSGASTVFLSRELPDVQIFSLESDSDYRDQSASQVKRKGNPECVELVHRPLRWQIHGLAPYRSYDTGELPAEVDAIIIDGPPHWCRRGREACLYQSFDRLRLGGRVYLDDYQRIHEQRIVKNWLLAYGDNLEWVKEFQTGNHIALLKKVGHQSKPNFSIRTFFDACLQALQVLIIAYKKRCRSVPPKLL